MPRSGTIISSRTTICSGSGPRRRDPGLHGVRQGLHHPMRGKARPCGGRGNPRFRPCTDGSGRVPLPPSAAAVLRKRSASAFVTGSNTRSAPSAICGGRYRGRKEGKAPTARPSRSALRAQEGAQSAGREPPLFPGKEQSRPGALAARNPAHRAHHRPVFLSATADQGDERGLRHLRPLHDHEHAVRPRQDRAKGRCWRSCRAIRTWSSSRRSTIRAIRVIQSLCAGLRHDAGHPAHLAPSRPRKIATGFPKLPAMATGARRCSTPGPTIATNPSSSSI